MANMEIFFSIFAMVFFGNIWKYNNCQSALIKYNKENSNMNIKELAEIELTQLNESEVIDANAMENVVGFCGLAGKSCGTSSGESSERD